MKINNRRNHCLHKIPSYLFPSFGWNSRISSIRFDRGLCFVLVSDWFFQSMILCHYFSKIQFLCSSPQFTLFRICFVCKFSSKIFGVFVFVHLIFRFLILSLVDHHHQQNHQKFIIIIVVIYNKNCVFVWFKWIQNFCCCCYPHHHCCCFCFVVVESIHHILKKKKVSNVFMMFSFISPKEEKVFDFESQNNR